MTPFFFKLLIINQGMYYFREISLPGNDTWKCAEYFWENLLIFAQISRNIHNSCFLRKCPGIITQKKIDFWVTIPGDKLIFGYCHSEINLFPGIMTRISIDFRVTIPGHFLRKQLLWIFLEILAKINKFTKKYSAHFRVLCPGSENSIFFIFKQLYHL